MAPPFVGVAVKVTDVPEQILFPGLAEIKTEGVTVGVIVTIALPFMLEEHAGVVVFVAITVYVPAAVWFPKLIAEPVPATGLPVLTPPICN